MRGKNIPLWITGMQHGHYFYIRKDKPISIKLPNFNTDHPFKVGKKSFVIYPYYINVEEIEPLRIFLEKKGYELRFETNSEYSNSTLKILFLHKDDDILKLDFSEIEYMMKDYELSLKVRKYD